MNLKIVTQSMMLCPLNWRVYIYLYILGKKQWIQKIMKIHFYLKETSTLHCFFMKTHKNETTSVVFGCRVRVKRYGQGPQGNSLKSSVVKWFFLFLCNILWYYKCWFLLLYLTIFLLLICQVVFLSFFTNI